MQWPSICGSIFVLLGAIWGQEEIPQLENVEILVTPVAGNISMLEATGDVAGNIAVSAGQDGFLLVDTQFAPLAGQIQQALDKIGTGEIRYVINTHHHSDHAHGNSVLGKNATVITHANAYRRLIQNPKARRPDVSFRQEMSLRFNGEEIRIIHLPGGHTDGDSVVWFTGSNVWHLGDLWNSGISSFPTVDLDAGGTVLGMLKNIERLIELIPEDARIIPGHYSVSDLQDLRATYDMLAETVDLVRRNKAAGYTLEQIKQAGLPPKYKSWGTGYASADDWIENLYRGLTSHPH
jgi:glyoxylase-like metal-dependent hydrolase (beta-lactamase superfamily II)